jgi:pilus assembly protein CpaF
VSVHEVVGMEGDIITMQEIYKFHRVSTDAEGNIHGHHRATGTRPRFMTEFAARGIPVPDDAFNPNVDLT